MGIINLLINILLGYGLIFYYNSQGLFADIALGFVLVCFVVFSFMRHYIWTIIITFHLPISKVYKNSFLLAFVNFKMTICKPCHPEEPIGEVESTHFVDLSDQLGAKILRRANACSG